MKYLKNYVKFVESIAESPTKPVTKPGIDTPTRTKPSRPGYVPTERPSEKDKPLALKQPGKEASVEDVYARLERLVGAEEVKNLIK